MRRLLLTCVVLSACAARSLPAETTPRPPIAWVPEARARLGHVTDDALGDLDAELERLRAIARFEIETGDPDHPGFDALLRLHFFDHDRAAENGTEAEAALRVSRSHDVLLAALPLAGPSAFAAIVELSPELLASSPDAILAFLRSDFPLGEPNEECSPPTVGFFLDALTRTLTCPMHYEPALDAVFPTAPQEVRVWLRLRGFLPATDTIPADEARAMVAASPFAARAYMHVSLLRGDMASAAAVAQSLRRADTRDISAQLVLLARDEIITGKLDADPRTLARLVSPLGAADVVHRFPEANAPKVVLLELLAYSQLPEDYDAVRIAASSASLDLLGPVLALLDATAHPSAVQSLDPQIAAVRETGSSALAAYVLSSPQASFARSDRLPNLPIDEALLALEPPTFALRAEWSRRASTEVRERLRARLSAPPVIARWRRVAECGAVGLMDDVVCGARGRAITDLTPPDLDARAFKGLEQTPFWNATLLTEMLDRFEGTQVSARTAYVRLRILALVQAGEREEARRRLSTDGRVLSRLDHLALETALFDVAEGRSPVIDTDTLGELSSFLDTAFARGCPITETTTEPSTEPVLPGLSALHRALAEHAQLEDAATLEALLPQFEGRAHQTLAAYLALSALLRRDRALAGRAFAESELGERTLVGKSLATLAAMAFSTDAAAIPDEARWISEWLGSLRTERRARPRAEAQTTTNARAEPPTPDPESLPPQLAAAYLRAMTSHAPADAQRFAAMRTDDPNARRVQCATAKASLDTPSTPLAVFHVPLPRATLTSLELIENKCIRDAPAGERDEEALRLLRAYSPAFAAQDDTSAGFDPWDPGIFSFQQRAAFARHALRATPPNFVLARLAGVSPMLTFALEDRQADARRARPVYPETAHVLAWLLEDLETGGIEKGAVLAMLSFTIVTERYERRTPLSLLATLLDAYPRSKTLAWFATWPRGGLYSPDSPPRDAADFFALRGEQLLRIADDEPNLLLLLASTLDASGRPRLAARALGRARALDPNVRAEEEPDTTCAPP